MIKSKFHINIRYVLLFGLGVFFAVFCIGTYQAVQSFTANNETKKASSLEQKKETKKEDSVSSLEEPTEAKEESLDELTSSKIVHEEQENTPTYQAPASSQNASSNSTTFEVPQQSSPSVSEQKNEANVLSYLEEQERIVQTANQNDSKAVDTVKNTFSMLYQFLFQDGTIKGYTFSELTETAKLKVIKIALTIDYKIDEVFPNYKEKIKSGFTSLKTKAIAQYLEITAKVCDRYQDTCTQAREDFKRMKENFGFTLSTLKSLLVQGSSALKEWYNSTK